MAKRILPALALVLALLLAGCEPFAFQNVGDLLQAPALGQGQAEIQNALAAYLGERPQFKYPKTGQWRSPLRQADLNGDGRDEAVLLYSLPDSTGAGGEHTNNVYIAVLEQIDGAWTVTQTAQGRGAEVASLEVADLLGDGTLQLLVGFAATSALTSKTLTLYTYQDQKLKDEYRSSYSMYRVDDFTGRGGSDLLVVSAGDSLGGLQLQYVPVVNGGFATDALPAPVSLDTNFSTCEAISPSEGPDGTRLLVVDGMVADSNSQMISQIVYYSGEWFYTQDPNPLRAATLRMTPQQPPLLKSRDINGDGRVETPLLDGLVVTLAGDKNLEYVAWMDFLDTAAEEPAMRQWGLVDGDRGVYITLPAGWRAAVSVEDGEESGEWVMSEKRTRRALLALRVIEPGITPPVGAVRVPGTLSTYLIVQPGLTQAERDTITMTALA